MPGACSGSALRASACGGSALGACAHGGSALRADALSRLFRRRSGHGRDASAVLLALLLGICTLPVAAQDLLIRNARVHTVDSAGTLDGTDVHVRAGRIVAVGKGLAAPGTQVVEAEGRALTPALFGGVTALGVEEVSLEPSTVDNVYTPAVGASPQTALPRPEFDVRPAFNPASMVIGVNRVEGIGFALVAPGAGGSIFAGIGAVARLDGRSEAFVDKSEILIIDLGSDAAAMSGSSRAAQYMLLEQSAREARPGNRALRDSDYQLLTAAGREVLAEYLGGGRIGFKVDRAADIRQVLAFARRTGSRAVIIGGSEAWKEAAALKASSTPVLLDALTNLPGSFDQLGATLENAARLHRAGVRFAFTQSGDATHNARKVRQGAGVAVAYGLPWEAALAALTHSPAEIFGLGGQLGRIAPGYQADLVLWSGDPLEVTSVATAMWIEGRPQSMRSRQAELRDRYRPK